jgi:cytochrome d ubiquinol oxidase subunit II
MMTEILIFFLGVSLFLYVLLGGADFGAGIVELFTGRKSIRTISKAIAPVWEANHIWIILVVVILFNGFPKVYTSITTYLHIPLLLALIGIIFRGTSFTFRYYDIPEKRIGDYYSQFFRYSSIITPFFFGTVLGAIISGRIPVTPEGSFYQVYVYPWLNLFSITTGIFVTILFGWLASVFLVGEAIDNKPNKENYIKTTYLFFAFLVLAGVLVFVTAQLSGIELLYKFWQSPISLGSLIFATVLAPIIWYYTRRTNVLLTRILAGMITFCILLGWFGIQLPVMVYISNGKDLTIWNSIAPVATIKYLVYALIAGILLIFPAIAYLYKVFKFNQT